METFSQSEGMEFLSLLISVVAAIAGILVIENTVVRFVLFLIVIVIGIWGYSYIQNHLQLKKEMERISKESLIQEARKVLENEIAQKEKIIEEAKARAKQELAERKQLEEKAKELAYQEIIEREAMQLIAHEKALKQAKERIEREMAEREITKARTVEAERLKAVEQAIVGRWTFSSFEIEFTKDKQIIQFGADMSYQFIDYAHIEAKSWCCTFMWEIIKISGDTLELNVEGIFGIKGDATLTRIK